MNSVNNHMSLGKDLKFQKKMKKDSQANRLSKYEIVSRGSELLTWKLIMKKCCVKYQIYDNVLYSIEIDTCNEKGLI